MCGHLKPIRLACETEKSVLSKLQILPLLLMKIERLTDLTIKLDKLQVLKTVLPSIRDRLQKRLGLGYRACLRLCETKT